MGGSFSVIMIDGGNIRKLLPNRPGTFMPEERHCDSLCLNRRLRGTPTDQPRCIRDHEW